MTTARQPRVLGTSKYKCCPQTHFIHSPRVASRPGSTAKPRGTSDDPFQLQDPAVGTTWGPRSRKNRRSARFHQEPRSPQPCAEVSRVRLQTDLAQSRNDARLTAASYEAAVWSYLAVDLPVECRGPAAAAAAVVPVSLLVVPWLRCRARRPPSWSVPAPPAHASSTAATA